MGVEQSFHAAQLDFSSRQNASFAYDAIRYKGSALPEEQVTLIENVAAALSNPQVLALVESGHITLGAIQPRVHEGKNLPTNDEEAAEVLLDEIGRDNILLRIPIILTREQAEALYAPHRETYQYLQASNDSTSSLWDSLIEFASSGSITFFLFYDEEGQAVEKWNERNGNVTPSEKDTQSIRAKYGRSEIWPNTLVHGSNSRQEAKRELGILVNVLSDIAYNSRFNEVP